MINHCRTLILNRQSDEISTYVDPKFVPVALPAPQKEVHDVLFTGDVSDATRDLVMKHYDGFLQLPEFKKFLTAIDPRVTHVVDNSLDDASVDLEEFHSLFSKVAAVVTRRIRDLFPERSKYSEYLSELRRIWTGSPHDHEKFAAVLFALAFVAEEIRSSDQ